MNRTPAFIWAAAAVVLASLSGPTTAAERGDSATAKRLADEGATAYKARDYRSAATLLREAVQRVAHPVLVFNWARALEQLAEFQAAAAAYSRSAALGPSGVARETSEARATASRNLFLAQQALDEGRDAEALRLATTADGILRAQASKAPDGDRYAEPASAMLLVARLQARAGSPAIATALLAAIAADATAPDVVLAQARQLATQQQQSPPTVVRPAPATPVVGGERQAAQPVSTAVAPAPHMQRPLLAKVMVCLGGAAALAGGGWYGRARMETAELQTEIDDATTKGGKIAGLSQQGYAAQRERLENSRNAGAAIAGAGAAVALGAIVWLAVAGRSDTGLATAHVQLEPVVGGAVVVAAWRR